MPTGQLITVQTLCCSVLFWTSQLMGNSYRGEKKPLQHLEIKAVSLEWKRLLISEKVTVHHTIVITSPQYNCKTCTVLVATLNIWINSPCDLCDLCGKILQDHSHHSEVFECSQVFWVKQNTETGDDTATTAHLSKKSLLNRSCLLNRIYWKRLSLHIISVKLTMPDYELYQEQK